MTRVALLTSLLLAMVALLAPSAGASPTQTTIGSVKVTNDLVYGKGRVRAPEPRNADLLLDLYRPVKSSSRPRPGVVLIHGGSFSGGSRKAPDLGTIARGLAKRGMVVANIDYRLSPQDPVPSSRVASIAQAAPDIPIFEAMVAAIDDTLTALDYLEENADRLGIDLERLGIVGESAGAITADHVAYILDDFDVEAPDIRFVGDLWGGIFLPPAPSLMAAANQVDAGEASVFSVHGTADTLVPVFLDDALIARARKVGISAKYVRIRGAGHGAQATGFFTREIAPGLTAYERMLDFAESALRRR